MYDLIILGGGPAGLAAADYALGKRLNFLVISRDLGGRTNDAPAIPEAEDYSVVKAREQVAVYRSRVHYRNELWRSERIVRLDAVPESDGEGSFLVVAEKPSGLRREYRSRAVLAATGSQPVSFDVPGAPRFWGRGLGTGARHYHHALWDRGIFLYGDSDCVLRAGLDSADFASRVHLAAAAGGTYSTELIARVRETPKIELIEDAVPIELVGDGFCRSIRVRTPDGEREIAADGFFAEFDPVPSLDYLSPELHPLLDGSGCIEVDKNMESSVPGLYAAGDACDMGRAEVLTALGQGMSAAIGICRRLRYPRTAD